MRKKVVADNWKREGGVSCSSQPVPNLCPLVRHPLTPRHFAPCGRRLSFGIPRGCERGTFRCPNPLLSPFVCLFFRCTCGRAGSSMSSMLIAWAGFNSSPYCLTANGSFSSIVSTLLAQKCCDVSNVSGTFVGIPYRVLIL